MSTTGDGPKPYSNAVFQQVGGGGAEHETLGFVLGDSSTQMEVGFNQVWVGLVLMLFGVKLMVKKIIARLRAKMMSFK